MCPFHYITLFSVHQIWEDGNKIFGEPDENGRCSVTKLRIARATLDAKGKKRNYPWYVQIENGKAVKAKNEKSGGCYIQANTYTAGAKVYVNINDFDMFKLLSRIQSFINAWECTYSPDRIRQAKQIAAKNMKESANK